jgi:hypothetical protein
LDYIPITPLLLANPRLVLQILASPQKQNIQMNCQLCLEISLYSEISTKRPFLLFSLTNDLGYGSDVKPHRCLDDSDDKTLIEGYRERVMLILLLGKLNLTTPLL